MNLLKVFLPRDFRNSGKQPSELVELSFNSNMTTGERFARAVFEDGTALVRRVNAKGKVVQNSLIQIPPLDTVEKWTEVIKILYETYTQQDIAAMLGISQATVSNATRDIEEVSYHA